MTANFQPPGCKPDRRPINPVIFIGTALLALVLIGGGMAWVLGMGPFAPAPSNSPGVTSTGANGQATPPAAGGPTAVHPSTEPTGDEVPSPTIELTPGPPNDDTGTLLSHVPEQVRGSCITAGFAEPILARVDCTPSADIAVFYALYADLADLTVAYNDRFQRVEIDRDSGLCYVANADGSLTATSERWPSEHEYTQQGQPIGRYVCDADGPASITWTDDRLYILAGATSPTDNSDALVSFWATEAGPIP